MYQIKKALTGINLVSAWLSSFHDGSGPCWARTSDHL